MPDNVDENVNTLVVKIIQSYTEIVNRMVWRKLKLMGRGVNQIEF